MSRPHHKTPIIIIVVSRGNYFYWLNCLNSPREEGYLDCYYRILLFFHGKHVGNVDNSGMNKKTITVQCFLCCFFFFLVGSQCFCFFLLSKASVTKPRGVWRKFLVPPAAKSSTRSIASELQSIVSILFSSRFQRHIAYSKGKSEFFTTVLMDLSPD